MVVVVVVVGGMPRAAAVMSAHVLYVVWKDKAENKRGRYIRNGRSLLPLYVHRCKGSKEPSKVPWEEGWYLYLSLLYWVGMGHYNESH